MTGVQTCALPIYGTIPVKITWVYAIVEAVKLSSTVSVSRNRLLNFNLEKQLSLQLTLSKQYLEFNLNKTY